LPLFPPRRSPHELPSISTDTGTFGLFLLRLPTRNSGYARSGRACHSRGGCRDTEGRAQAKDVDGAVANYADDGSWLPPNAPMVNGKAAIRAGWWKLIGSPGFNIDWHIDKLEVGRAGDLAYTIYTYQLILEGPNGKPITDHGKDMAIWKKQSDGSWKMIADTFNSDLPSVAPAPAKTHETRHGATKHRPGKKHRKTK
jgi:ketosteroid isomerase-like protein